MVSEAPPRQSVWRQSGLETAPVLFREPELVGYRPEWWHGHGSKMILDGDASLAEEKTIIRGSAAEVAVPPYEGVEELEGYWLVEWKIRHSPAEGIEGRVLFDSAMLSSAFGLSNASVHGEDLLRKHGGTAAEPGRYIRFGNFLSIPGPGTGHDGDPNVSIELRPETTQAISEMMEAR